jgi:photosystem II stability/assembly factor-like uncharacterized protein
MDFRYPVRIGAVLLCSSLFILISGNRVSAQDRTSNAESESLSKPVALPPPMGLYKEFQNVPEKVRQSAPFARALHEMERVAGSDGTFDVEARVRAFQQSQEDLINSSVMTEKLGTLSNGANQQPFSTAWTNIGLVGSPSNGVYSGGCTTTIAIDPTNTNIMYVGATSGGVWKSTDAGAHWTALTDLVIPNLSVASIAIDPKNHNTLYVGTGNGFASIDELTGTGIYKTTDGGGNWSRIGASTISGTVVKVMIDSVHSNVLLASLYSTNRGVYRSTDSGATWSKVYPSSGNAAGVIWDIASGTVVSGTPLLYFLEGNNPGGGASECGIYKSINDGASWSKITATIIPKGNEIGRGAIAIPASNPSRVFVLLANPDGDAIYYDSALFRSTDNGSTWSTIAIPTTVFKPLAQAAAQGWYDCILGVTPRSSSSADTIYIGGVEGWVNYSDGTGWIQWAGYNSPYYDWSQYPHVDQHSIAFNPKDPSHVFIGGDGGLYLSLDAGNSWSYRSNQMVTNRFYRIGLSPQTSEYKNTYAGAQDQGTWFIVTGGTTENTGLGGDGSQPIVSPFSSNTIYSELSEGEIYKSTIGIQCGSCWNEIDGSITDNAQWDAPLVMSRAAKGSIPAYDILYAGRPHLWRTINAGSSWDTISPEFANGPISAVGISLVDSRNIYVGLQYGGGIWLTTNGGSSWSQKLSSTPTVTSIVTTGRDTNFVLASFYTTNGARVMRSTHKGANWTSVTGLSGSALPAVGVNCVALDSVNPLRIWYAATDNGIYYTIDTGKHWTIAGSGLGLAPCRDVQVQANKTTIRVATFGRGIWEAATNVLPVELSTLTYQKTSSGTQLLWHTDSERGDQGFYVERSVNSGSFEDVTFMPSSAPGGVSNMEIDYTWLDTARSAGTYLYQLKQVDLDGTEHFSNFVEVHYGNDQMIVYQNFPNPFVVGQPSSSGTGFNPFGSGNSIVVQPAPQTRIEYELPANDVVSLKIYNSTGKLVRTLLQSVAQAAGEQDAYWDALADDGAVCPSGTYFYVLESQQSGTFVNKLVLLSN